VDRNNNDVSNAADHNNGAVREATVNNNSSSHNSRQTNRERPDWFLDTTPGQYQPLPYQQHD
jgi:hypothetical protein